MNDGTVPAVPSATVVVVREAAAVPEVLLVRRRAGDAFGDSYAFPGGVVDHDEQMAHVFCANLSATEANETLGVDDGLDYYSAVIRELFEETGILLARHADGRWADAGSSTAGQRASVDRGELRWPAFLRQQGLCMAADALHYFAWWETPRARPKRWTTRFFMARLPPGQAASLDGTELTDLAWLSAADALAAGERGELPMPFPTKTILRDMAPFDKIEGLLDWARRRRKAGIGLIRPVIVQREGQQAILVPGDSGYGEAERA